jgi:uncharacterized protein
MSRRPRCRAAALGLLLAGCSFLEPRADPTRFFVLSPVTDAGAAVADPGLAIVLGPVLVPDYLVRPEIVSRTGPNQVDPSRLDRWAEPIDRALVRVLCLDLAALLPRSSVVAFPAAAGAKPDVTIEIEIDAFEAERAGPVRLAGRWHVRSARDPPRAAREFRLERPLEGGETPAIVAGMSDLLAELAGDIAAELGAGTAH